jgi:molecular chaperone DnaK
VKEAAKGSNLDELKSATEALNQVWQSAASAMYAQTQQQADAQAGQAGDADAGKGKGKGKGKKVEDADFEVVDDDDKK